MADGVLFIHKPKGVTSRDVVNKISKIYHTKKVGHTGTLDPIATGLLIICLGHYTKLVNSFTGETKEYIGTMKLGIQTDTGDITGNIIQMKEKQITEKEIIDVFQNFPKEYIQTVPIYSAVKVNGKKLYEYARRKEEVLLPKRNVSIFHLKILKIEGDTVTFQVEVSKGTYIRALIEDLGKMLGTVATMTELTRTKLGNFLDKDSLELASVTEDTPLKTLSDLFSYPKIEITEEELKKVKNGNMLSIDSQEERVFFTYQQQVIAIYQKKDLVYQMIFKVI